MFAGNSVWDVSYNRERDRCHKTRESSTSVFMVTVIVVVYKCEYEIRVFDKLYVKNSNHIISSKSFPKCHEYTLKNVWNSTCGFKIYAWCILTSEQVHNESKYWVVLAFEALAIDKMIRICTTGKGVLCILLRNINDNRASIFATLYLVLQGLNVLATHFEKWHWSMVSHHTLSPNRVNSLVPGKVAVSLNW